MRQFERLPLAAAVAGLLIMGLAAPLQAEAPKSFAQAKRLAAKRQTPILLEFSTEW